MDIGHDVKEAPANGVERRRKPRYLFSLAMTIRSANGLPKDGISIEMSETGMSATVNGFLRVDETVNLELVAGGKAQAVVRHKLGQLYGFEFVGLSAERSERITEACKKLGRYRTHARGA